MSDKPASYRAGTASFELHFGSALKAILPGAFQGSVIGSLLVASYAIVQFATSGELSGLSGLLGLLMLFLAIVMAATMAGMIVCSIYIGVIGFPLALLLRRRIATRGALVLALLVASAAALVSSYLFLQPLWAQEFEAWLLTGLALAYAIPAGIAYRQAIITERLLSFWSGPAG